MEIAEFARQNALSISDVWKDVRRGKLIARSLNGQFEVYSQVSGQPRAIYAEENTERLAVDPASRQGATAGANPTVKITPELISRFEPAFSRPGDREDRPAENSLTSSQPTEIALLLDHLSLAKDENREILRMATESINQMTLMTREALSSKDEILQQKTQELHRLGAENTKKDHEIQRLRQDVEDLQMLSRTLGDGSAL